MKKLYAILLIAAVSFSFKIFDSSPFNLGGGNFSQNWTTTTLITANDSWTGVASIQGFLGDDPSNPGTGVDPQTVLVPLTTIDVIANQSSTASTSGGVAEFDGIPNPTIALQGSGTADAPNIIVYLNTTGRSSVNVQYNVRDIDGTTDNAVQPVALQYRVGGVGNFVNVPAGFVADATTGPSLATLVTAVNATLPAACDNQALVEVRIMTTNAASNDEWVGIDDIVISSVPVAANTVSVSSGLNATEGNVTDGTFTITFSPATAAASTDVNYAFTGSATFTTDYTVSFNVGTATGGASGTLQNIPAGTSSITAFITPVNDVDVEGTENITLTLSAPTAGYTLGTAAASIDLNDNDAAPTVSIAAGVNGAEPATNGTFILTLSSPAPVGGTTITYTLTGTATSGADYNDALAGSITIPASQTSGTITIATLNDPTVESPETVIATLNTVSAPYALGTSSASINITSDDAAALTPISINAVTTAYTENFNSLANTGTSSITPSGWVFNETGSSANTVYTASTGSGTAGDTYSFGAASNTERAFGSIGSGAVVTNLGAYYVNNSGTTINRLGINFIGEQWRLGATARADRLDFQYSLDATSLTTGTWIDVDGLDFNAPVTGPTVGALDGNAGANQTSVSFTITGLSIPNGANFFIRWTDFGAAGADDGLGIDDYSIEANPIDLAAPLVLTLSPAIGATGVSTNPAAVITFNETIVKGTGNILVRRSSDNSIVQTIDVSTAAVNVSGPTASFSITGLLPATGYYIDVPTGAFEDQSGNDFVGISGPSSWAFTTGSTFYIADFNACTGSISDGFTQFSETGAITWACTAFGRDPSNPTASLANGVQMNGFSGGTNVPNVDWLISPSFNLTGTTFPLLSFWSRTAFNGLPLTLKVSTNYTGGDPNLATWTDINGKFPALASNVWTLSENINLSAFKQPSVHFAFVYTSTDDDGARWTIDDVRLDNSPVAPPATLTFSTPDIQFGFAAMGNNVTKSFVVTGNDITGDITLTASANFSLATAPGGPFGPVVTLTQAAANNIPTTLYARFTPAQDNRNYTGTITVQTAGVADTTISLKGTSVDPVNTLEVVNWNIEWFGSTANGPTNEPQQEANASTILNNINADVYGLIEIVDEAALARLVSNMPGYSYVISNYGSHTNTSANPPSALAQAQKLVFVYKNSVISNVTTAPLLSQGINSAADLSNPAYNYFASGRFPYMMTADVTLNSVTRQVRFVLVHGKANTSPTATSYARRKNGSDTLKYTLNALYPNDNILILGDINDDLDSTITADIFPRITSYIAFTADTVTTFTAPTLALSLAGKKSTVAYNDMIDHVIVSNEMSQYFMQGSASVLNDVTSLVGNYANSTSDHYPVFTRFAFDPVILPVKLVTFNAVKQGANTKISWSTSQEINSREFRVERSANGRTWETIAIVPAAGNSSSLLNYAAMDLQPAKGMNLYRLRAIDLDDKFEFSSIRRVNFDELFTYTIYPNPASSVLMVSVDNAGGLNADIQVVNAQSQLLISKKLTGNNQPVQLNVGQLNPGMYFIKIISADGTLHVQKFIKQ